jgi:hypothetical protein
MRLAARLRSLAVPSLDEQRVARDRLNVWRALSAPIVDPANLRRAERAFAERQGWMYLDEDDDGDDKPVAHAL